MYRPTVPVLPTGTAIHRLRHRVTGLPVGFIVLPEGRAWEPEKLVMVPDQKGGTLNLPTHEDSSSKLEDDLSLSVDSATSPTLSSPNLTTWNNPSNTSEKVSDTNSNISDNPVQVDYENEPPLKSPAAPYPTISSTTSARLLAKKMAAEMLRNLVMLDQVV